MYTYTYDYSYVPSATDSSLRGTKGCPKEGGFNIGQDEGSNM